MTEPMTDAEMDGLRSNIFAYNRKERPRLMLSGQNVIRLLARLDAAETARDAALARALPEPVLMETVEQVEALPDGNYAYCFTSGRRLRGLATKRNRVWTFIGADDECEPNSVEMVGAWVARLPDLPIPTPGDAPAAPTVEDEGVLAVMPDWSSPWEIMARLDWEHTSANATKLYPILDRLVGEGRVSRDLHRNVYRAIPTPTQEG